MIVANSPYQEDFIKPQHTFEQLFTPQVTKLEPHEFAFLNNFSDGNILLDKIEYYYENRIYFGFDQCNQALKIYSDSHLINPAKSLKK